MDFTIGAVLASFVGAILFVFVSAFISRRARRGFVWISSRVLGVDVEAVFRNKANASEDVDAELRKAETIWIMTGRGNELQRGVLAEILGSTNPRQPKTVQIVLPQADFRATKDTPDWLSIRERELIGFDRAYGDELLRNQVRATLRYLESPVRERRAEVRVFNFPHVGRIMGTDSVVYLNRYGATAHGRDCEIVKFRRGGPMYEYLRRIFDVLWAQARDPFQPRRARKSEDGTATGGESA